MFGRKMSTKNQGIWITSDLHFWHKNVMKFCADNRPWNSLEEMHEALIEDWNCKVEEDDYIIHLGDFSFKGKEATESILSRLKGKKIFLYGNHDKCLRNQISEKDFNIAFKGDYLELKIDGIKVILSHYHLSNFNQQGRGAVMLFGHSHGNYEPEGRTTDCGWDKWGTIMNVSGILDYCLEKDVFATDHHKEVKSEV